MDYEIFSDGLKVGVMTDAQVKSLSRKSFLNWVVWLRGVGLAGSRGSVNLAGARLHLIFAVKVLLLLLAVGLMVSLWSQVSRLETLMSFAALWKLIQFLAVFLSYFVALVFIMPSVTAEANAEYCRLVRKLKGLPDDCDLVIARNGYA